MYLGNLKCTFILIPVLFLFLIISGYSQTDTTVKGIDSEIDTSKIAAKLELVRKIGENAIKQVVSENLEKQIHFRQLALLDELDKEINKINERFKRGIDTVLINKEIKLIEEQFRIASEGTLTGEMDIQTIRNLNTSSVLISEILTRLNENKKRTEAFLSDLSPLKNRIDSL